MAKRDLVKPGCGIDGSKGENFTKKYRDDPWSPPRLSDELSPVADRKAKHADNAAAGLRNKLPDERVSKPHDIYDNVNANSDEFSGAVKYGVD